MPHFPLNLSTLAVAASWLWAGLRQPGGWKGAHLPLLGKVLGRGDLHWPRRVARWTRGRRVLDVGCGRNLQGPGFIALGARSYTGLDPTLDLDSTLLKDSRTRWSRRTESGLSLRAVMAACPRVRYVRASLAEFAAAEPGQFEVLVMHNVTEHLMELEKDSAHFAALLAPGGTLVFRHPNFYAWHGHHLPPRTIAEIDAADPAQAAVLDWAHVRFDPARHAWIGRTQNRVRLETLRALIERHFAIELWDETESPHEQGLDRLTPEILARYPEFTRRDLAVKCAFIVARKRP